MIIKKLMYVKQNDLKVLYYYNIMMNNLSIKLFILFFIYLTNAQLYFKSKDEPEKYLKNKDVCNILSLSGGGSFGAVEIGILSEIYQPYYDLMAGVSAGSINVGLLSYFNSPSDTKLFKKGIDYVKNVYAKTKTSNFYVSNFYKAPTTWGVFDNTPARGYADKILSTLIYPVDKQPTLVGTVNLNEGYLEIFRYDNYDKIQQRKLILASTSIPFLFPPHNINGTLYSDGGLISNHILLGIQSFIKCNNYNITYISASPDLEELKDISTPKMYTDRLLSILLGESINQLNQFISIRCNFVSTVTINYCYPTNVTELDKYYKLDFDYGEELYNIGKKSYKCEKYDFC